MLGFRRAFTSSREKAFSITIIRNPFMEKDEPFREQSVPCIQALILPDRISIALQEI
jgi:hypothetical protein